VLPGAGLEDAQGMAERLAEAMRTRPLEAQGKPIHLQASIGLATLPLEGKPVRLDDLVHWADGALYRAKQAGRGQVRLHLP
jgi:two-component system cell cycle response regulator